MDPTLLAGIAGIILIVAGVGLIAAQAIFPAHFQNMQKDLGIQNLHLKTNIVGFGVLLLGFLLMMAQLGVNVFGK